MSSQVGDGASTFSLGGVVGCSGVELDASFGNHPLVVFFLGFRFLHMKRAITHENMKRAITHEKLHLPFLCSI
jgi:hypothetical protein